MPLVTLDYRNDKHDVPVAEVISETLAVFMQVKGKGVPLQARCGPEGSRRFRLPDFHDIRHMNVVRSSASRTDRLYPQEMFMVLIFTRG